MANIGTSTVAYATRQTAGQTVFIASDGAACVLWCDGTNQVLAYDDSSYASWTKVTHTTGLNMVLTGHFRAGTDNIDTITGGTSNVRGNYRLLTKSGATWTVGTANGMSGTTAIGVTAQGSPSRYAGQDAQGRHWVSVPGATNTLTTNYYSAANSPTTTGWTTSGAVTQTADLFTPASDQVGNYLVFIYWNGTALQWKRVDNSAASVGAWSTAATIPNLTGSPNASSAVHFKAMSATDGLLTYSTGSGIYAQVYNGTTFGAATQLSTNANDRHPTIASDNAGNAWIIWCSYVGANDYALVYKKYNGATYDSGATTLVASGTNITYPNAGYGASTVGITYTQGTGSPYTVGWAQIGGSAHKRAMGRMGLALPGTVLTLYGSATADATLTNACDVATVAGGVETSKVSDITSGSGNFAEVWSKGGYSVAVAAIPSTPTGHGWAYQPGEGTFIADDWDAIITCTAMDNSGSWRLRFFKYDGASTYTPITTLTKTITATAKTVYNFPAASASSVDFLSTDWLYFDLYYETTYGASSNTVTVYEATTSAAGVANEMQIATARFVAAAGGGTANKRSTGRLKMMGAMVKRAMGRVKMGGLGLTRAVGRVRLQASLIGLRRATSRARLAIQNKRRTSGRAKLNALTLKRATAHLRLWIRTTQHSAGRLRFNIKTAKRATGRGKVNIKVYTRSTGRGRLGITPLKRATGRSRLVIRHAWRATSRARLSIQAIRRSTGRFILQAPGGALRRASARARLSIKTTRRAIARMRVARAWRASARTRLAIKAVSRATGRMLIVVSGVGIKKTTGRARLSIRTLKRAMGRLSFGILGKKRSTGRSKLSVKSIQRSQGRVTFFGKNIRHATARARLWATVAKRVTGRLKIQLTNQGLRRAIARMRLLIKTSQRAMGRTRLGRIATRRASSRARLYIKQTQKSMGRTRLGLTGKKRSTARVKAAIAKLLHASARVRLLAQTKYKASGRIRYGVTPVRRSTGRFFMAAASRPRAQGRMRLIVITGVQADILWVTPETSPIYTQETTELKWEMPIMQQEWEMVS